MSEAETMTKKLIQTPHIVAHIDFLGASKKMLTPGESNDFLQKINCIYSTVLQKKNLSIQCGLSNLKVRIFSDNIVIAKKIRASQYPLNEFISVQAFAQMLQAYAFSQGELVRGAITKGDFFINDTFVYGEALCKAYRMETNFAKYPRIIIDPCIFPNGILPYISTGVHGTRMNLIIRDKDGMYYLNIFNFMEKYFSQDEFKEILPKIKEAIVHGYSDSFNANEAVLSKYIWLAEKFNEFYDACNLQEHKILMSILEVSHE